MYILQLFHLDVAKQIEGCCICCICCKCFQRYVANVCSRYFMYFQMYVAMFFNLDVAYVATVCFQMFQLFQSYVGGSGLMFQVTSVLFWMFHLFSVLYVAFMLQVFYVVQSGVS